MLVQNVSVARLANSLGGQKSPDGFRFDLENSGTPTSNITIINVDIGNVSPFWRYREQSVSALLDSPHWLRDRVAATAESRLYPGLYNDMSRRRSSAEPCLAAPKLFSCLLLPPAHAFLCFARTAASRMLMQATGIAGQFYGDTAMPLTGLVLINVTVAESKGGWVCRGVKEPKFINVLPAPDKKGGCV